MLKRVLELFRVDSIFNENHPPSKVYIRTIFMTMSFISAVVTFGILVTALLFDFGMLYIMFSLMIPVLFFGMFLLDVLKKYQWSRFYGTTILPAYLNIITICTGGGFSETPVMLAFLIFAYVLYDKKPKLKFQIILFNLFCHTGVLAYIAFYPPLISTLNYSFDEVVVFLLAIGWIYVFLKKYEYEKNKYMLQLEDKNKKLLATTDELERFTYIASHDLKSPLRTIISFSDLIAMHLKKEEYHKLKEDLSFIKSGANQMNYLIQDILEFSQINGKKEIEKSELDLNEILEKVESNLHSEIQEKKVIIQKENLPSYFANQTEFILLFQNLIQNGIKYNSSEMPTIHIWSEQSDSELSIFVKDNGIGIEKNYHEKIFQFFKRLHTTDQYQGTGLGLGLCKKLIEKYGGHISVESEIEKGSTFKINIPSNGVIENSTEQSSESPVAQLIV